MQRCANAPAASSVNEAQLGEVREQRRIERFLGATERFFNCQSM